MMPIDEIEINHGLARWSGKTVHGEYRIGDLPFGQKGLKIAAEQGGCIPLNVLQTDFSSRPGRPAIHLRHDAGNDLATVIPFIDQLVQNTGIGMLRHECPAEQLKPHLGDFSDQAGIVEKPPATERHQIAELPRHDAEFMLIFA